MIFLYHLLLSKHRKRKPKNSWHWGYDKLEKNLAAGGLMVFWNDRLKWTPILDNETPLLRNERRSSLEHRNFNEITLRLLVGNTLKKKPVIY